MKKLLALLLAVLMVASFAACSSGGGSGDKGSTKGEISVFYYTFSDAYISTVRSSMDKILSDGGYTYNDYDANGNQTTQTEQVQTALAKGSSLLIVNVVDTGSNDAAQNIINLAKAKNVPVIFFNRSVEQSVIESYDKCVFVGTDYEQAGHMQGKMIGEYVLKNYGKLDLNNDGVNDVCVTDKAGSEPGVKYIVRNSERTLEEGNSGRLVYNLQRYFDEQRYVHPIPKTALDKNPDLGQNAAWK